MKLTRLFAVSITLLAVLIAAMLGRILWDEWWQYRAVRDGVHTLQLVQHAMRAAEQLSVERGPVNGVLGDAAPPDPVKAARLRSARAATDLAPICMPRWRPVRRRTARRWPRRRACPRRWRRRAPRSTGWPPRRRPSARRPA